VGIAQEIWRHDIEFEGILRNRWRCAWRNASECL